MRCCVGGADVTMTLGKRYGFGRKGKGYRIFLQFLFTELIKIDTRPLEPRRGAGFHPPHGKPDLLEMFRQAVRRKLSGAAGLEGIEADMDPAAQKCAGCKHHRFG